MDTTDKIAYLHAEYTELRKQVATLQAQAEELQHRIGHMEKQLEQDVDISNQPPIRGRSRQSTAATATFTLSQTALILGVDYKTVYNLVRKGELGSLRIGGQYTIPQVELETYMEKVSIDLTQGRQWALVHEPGEELPRAVILDSLDYPEWVSTEG